MRGWHPLGHCAARVPPRTISGIDNPVGGAVARQPDIYWSVKVSTDLLVPESEPLTLNPAQLARFLVKIEKAVIREEFGICWVWTAATTDKGYGKFYVGKTPEGKPDIQLAHRVAFQHYKQEVILPGFIVDHECSHKSCVRPAHLTQVGNIQNLKLASERRPWRRRNQYSID